MGGGKVGKYFCPHSITHSPMPLATLPSALPPDTAVLLVLLPLGPRGEMTGEAARTTASLRALQGRLGAAIRVLRIDEASHPAVVHSFGPPQLPACVLVRQGVELWRSQGLPEDEAVVTALLEIARL